MKKTLKEIYNRFLQSFWQHYICWSFGVVALFTAFYALLIYMANGELFYVDTDCYTRALRILDWLQNFEWREKIFPYNNYPDGFVLHFTRISDIIWLIFTLPFIPFMPLKDAIFYGGFFFSPFFLFLTLISFLWGVKPYLENIKHNKVLFLSIFVFAMLFCCKLTNIFDFYRPDHHGITCFVFAFVISAIWRSYNIKQNLWELFIAGVLTGIGLWASSAIEGFYIAGIALLILTINAIFFQQNTKNPLYYALGFFYANFGAWLINPPFGGYGILDNARLSIIHVAISAFIVVSFTAWHFLNFRKKFKQIFAIAFFAVISILLLIILFGTNSLFAPIYDEYVIKYFVPYILEMKPLDIFLLPPILVGMIIVLFLSVKNSHKLILFLLYFITALTAAFVSRFYIYYINVWLLLYAYGLVLLINIKNKGTKYKIAAFIYLIWPIFYLAAFEAKPTMTLFPKLHGVVLADTFKGPELVWQQDVDTVASPYHTNPSGIRDNRILWFTSNETELKELLNKRNISYITLYDTTEFVYYENPQANTDKLYGKVLTGKNLYPWMEKTAERTYRVNYDKF